MLGIRLEYVCNFDKTNVFFLPASKHALARIGDKTIGALRADSSQQCMVMMGVSTGGCKFSPYVIYKGRNRSNGTINRQLKRVSAAGVDFVEGDGFPMRNHYALQENAWMSSDPMVHWVNKVYRPWSSERNGPTMLIC
jgi:hypothetical protein